MKQITKKWNTESKRPVILLDYDDVLFDFLGTVLKWYNREKKTSLKVQDVTSWDLSEIGDIHTFMKIIHNADLWKEIPAKGNSMKVVQRLINDGRWNIYICTSCTTLQEYVVKTEVIEKSLPGFDISKVLNVSRKEIIRGDVLIDDKLENLIRCKPYMECILMDMPHNQQTEAFRRINTLEELPSILEDMFCY